MKQADIGIIGLAVMGENLVLNFVRNGYSVAVYTRTVSNVTKFKENRGASASIIGTYSLAEFVSALAKPRKIMLLIKAGAPVDSTLEQLIPLLDKGDIVLDGGNSDYRDTMRREAMLREHGIFYLGTGVSGGEEGALNGPSLMPGGDRWAYNKVAPLLRAISAKYNNAACVTYIGPSGAGHFVKMVHNGIEYGDMQLISETYDLMLNFLHLDHDRMAEVFARWNSRKLNSYLIEITADIMRYKDHDGTPLLTKIVDVAGQKGTGKWTAINALERGVALPLITEAVNMRFLSALTAIRAPLRTAFSAPHKPFKGNNNTFINHLERALYAAKIISYAQGFHLMSVTSDEFKWDINLSDVAKIWRAGCIIRSKFLNNISTAYRKDSNLAHLLLDPYFTKEVNAASKSLRYVVKAAVDAGISVPALSSALQYFDSLRTVHLPTNLIQAQRDYFGAHTYLRTDDASGTPHHTNWTKKGGSTTSNPYEA